MNLNDVQGVTIQLGAIYGAVQALAQAVMKLTPSHTILWKVCKFLVSGPQRPQEAVVAENGG